MRNILRVILWGLPPSFCALVQRAGRAGRDFSVAAEAILIVTPATMKKGISDAEILKMARKTVGPHFHFSPFFRRFKPPITACDEPNLFASNKNF